MTALFLMQTYGGMSQETGARYEASYHCTNIRVIVMRTQSCIVARHGMRTEKVGKIERYTEKKRRKDLFILLEMHGYKSSNISSNISVLKYLFYQ